MTLDIVLEMLESLKASTQERNREVLTGEAHHAYVLQNR